MTDKDNRELALTVGAGAIGALTALIGILSRNVGAMLGAVVGGTVGGIAGFAALGPAGAIAGATAGALSGAAVGYGLTEGLGGGSVSNTLSQATATPAAATPGPGGFIPEPPPLSGLTRPPFFMTPVGMTALGGATFVGVSIAGTIITQTAFIDPLNITPQANEISKYVSVSKTVTPSTLTNNKEAVVNYTIEITPKESYVITPVIDQTTDEFSYLGGTALKLDSPTETVRSQLGSEPISASKKITYSVKVVGEDVLVNNNFHFVFTVEGETEPQILDVLGSLTIGTPEIGCFVFGDAGFNFSGVTSKAWKEDEKQRIMTAFSCRAGKSPKFLDKLCNMDSDGDGDKEPTPVEIYRLGGMSYGGWAPSGYKGKRIGIYDLGIIYSVESTEYTLVHELGHILDYRNPDLRSGFKTVWGGSCFSYPFPDLCVNSGEPFAEATVLYAISQTYRFSNIGLYDFKGKWPNEYKWIGENIYGQSEGGTQYFDPTASCR
jgi:hypothetical protein